MPGLQKVATVCAKIITKDWDNLKDTEEWNAIAGDAAVMNLLMDGVSRREG